MDCLVLEYANLSNEYQSTQAEHDALNEQYLNVELESFEIGSYYELTLAEEKAKTVQLEARYHEQLQAKTSRSSLPSSTKSHKPSSVTN